MKTTCEYCGASITLTAYDDTLVGDECACGEYVTRYTPEFRAEADWL